MWIIVAPEELHVIRREIGNDTPIYRGIYAFC